MQVNEMQVKELIFTFNFHGKRTVPFLTQTCSFCVRVRLRSIRILSGCVPIPSCGAKFCVKCLWERSKQRTPDYSGSPMGRMRMKPKRNADSKGTGSCQERYFYCTFIRNFYHL